MEEHNDSKLIEFWLTAEQYRKSREHIEPDQAPEHNLQDAMLIYDKLYLIQYILSGNRLVSCNCCRYISMQAPSDIALAEKERIALENAICREGGPLSTCFLRAQQAVLRRIEQVGSARSLDLDLFHPIAIQSVPFAEVLPRLPLVAPRTRPAVGAAAHGAQLRRAAAGQWLLPEGCV